MAYGPTQSPLTGHFNNKTKTKTILPNTRWYKTSAYML